MKILIVEPTRARPSGPKDAPDDLVHRADREVISGGQVGGRTTLRLELAKLIHIFPGKLRATIQFALSATGVQPGKMLVSARPKLWSQAARMPVSIGAATFLCTVAVIVANGSERKMVRIDAAPIVTAMQHAQPVRDGAASDEPREAMREHWSLPDMPLTVSTLGEVAGPRPASAFVWLSLPEPEANNLLLSQRRFATFEHKNNHEDHSMTEMEVFQFAS